MCVCVQAHKWSPWLRVFVCTYRWVNTLVTALVRAYLCRTAWYCTAAGRTPVECGLEQVIVQRANSNTPRAHAARSASAVSTPSTIDPYRWDPLVNLHCSWQIHILLMYYILAYLRTCHTTTTFQKHDKIWPCSSALIPWAQVWVHARNRLCLLIHPPIVLCLRQCAERSCCLAYALRDCQPKVSTRCELPQNINHSCMHIHMLLSNIWLECTHMWLG